MIHAIRWRWGFRVWLGRFTFAVLGPNDSPLFSERHGFRRPLLAVGPWRFFARMIDATTPVRRSDPLPHHRGGHVPGPPLDPGPNWLWLVAVAALVAAYAFAWT